MRERESLNTPQPDDVTDTSTAAGKAKNMMRRLTNKIPSMSAMLGESPSQSGQSQKRVSTSAPTPSPIGSGAAGWNTIKRKSNLGASLVDNEVGVNMSDAPSSKSGNQPNSNTGTSGGGTSDFI